MASVTQTIPTYLGGVSKQIDSKKKPGQVRESTNALPDPTFGLMKRPGTEFVKSLTTSALPNAKWFYIHRDGDEQYIGRVSTGNPGNIAVWNAVSGTACTVHYDGLPWAAETAYAVGERITNDGGKIYVCVQAGTSLAPGGTSGPSGTGTNIADNTVRWDYVSAAAAQNYLKVPSGVTDSPLVNYDILTVQDTTFITNKNKEVTPRAAPSFTAGKKATIRLLNVKYGSRYNVKIDGTATSGGDSDPTRIEDPTTAGTVLLNTKEILQDLATQIAALNGWSVDNITQLDASLELEHSSAFTIEAVDDSGSTNLEVFQEQVNTVSNLPDQSIHGRLVKIINTESDKSTYWATFKAENTTYNVNGTVNTAGSGRGFWEETIDPTVSPGLTGSTMPHELRNTDLNTFVFKEVIWKDRLCGDNTTNEHPSFVNTSSPRTIQQAFLHNNRLGFLTEDNVSISQAQDYYNFYFTSALTITSADPVDVSASSIKPALLNGVVPTAQGLILFSKNQQFMLWADQGIITPTTAIIRSISNYEMDTNIDPVDVGTSITFVSKTPSYTRLFGMQTRGSEENPIIQDISKQVSEWIPADVNNLFSSPQNTITGVYSTNSNDVHMYRVYKTGEEELMQSWFKWELPGKVQFFTIDNDVIWIVIETENADCILLKSSISKAVEAENAVLTTVDGKEVNPHIDLYETPTAANNVALSTDGKDTLIDIPYVDLTSRTPVLLIKGEDGFTITPTRNNSNQYVIANKDLKTDTTYSDILLGYKYNYDVEIPRVYYTKPDKIIDQSASLTIARMKFAVGLSSVCSFKVKSKGYRGPIAEFTGDGSTTAFVVPFLLKEENGIKVTLDGARQASTAYTVTSTDTQSTVTFGTAPTGETTTANKTTPAQKIAITTDTWYDVQPVQDAGQYLADDVPLAEDNIFTIPLHQRSGNFDLRVFSNSPFPVSLNSMMWEGQYSPRYYRRT